MCAVAHSDALQQAMVIVQWISPRGEVIGSSSGIGNTSLPLNFPQLSLADAGRYTCRATIVSPLLNGPRIIQSNLDVIPVTDPGKKSINFDIFKQATVRLFFSV